MDTRLAFSIRNISTFITYKYRTIFIRNVKIRVVVYIFVDEIEARSNATDALGATFEQTPLWF